MIRDSDTQFLVLGNGDLTTWSEGKVVDRPTRVIERPRRVERDTGRTRRSSASGTDDPYCHILVGAPPYGYTSCGLRIKPPLTVERTHHKPPCPNGHPPCPECVRVRASDDDLNREVE
jgi:hypothetical protein